MPDLAQLYQDIILGHNKNPANYGVLPGSTAKATAFNPLCGDEVTVYWKLWDGRFTEIQFEAQGCAISKASASMMTVSLKGKTLAEAKQQFAELTRYLRDADSGDSMDGQLGDLVALSGVRKFPSRVKCATLAWHALFNQLDHSGA